MPSSPLKRGTDVIFLVDSSRGVAENVLKREKEFVKSLALNFDISSTGPRGSAVSYGDNPVTIVRFQEPDFARGVERTLLLNTPRRIDKALEHAAQMFKTEGREGRRILILLTAGRQTSGGKSLDEAIKRLRDLDVQTFVVAIGQQPDLRQLISLVDRQQDIFQASSHDGLLSQSGDIGKKVLEKPGKKSSLS